jgi:hypothetical protein
MVTLACASRHQKRPQLDCKLSGSIEGVTLYRQLQRAQLQQSHSDVYEENCQPTRFQIRI